MQAIAYSELRDEVCDLVGWDGTNLDDGEFRQVRRAISRAIGEAWRYCFWPDTMVTEQRTFHPEWDVAEEVEAGLFRYFPPTGEYYQALVMSTGQAPAAYVDGEWTIDTTRWSLARRTLNAEPWESTNQYALGDVVYDAEGFKWYQAFAVPPVGTEVSDTDYWAEITELDPVIPWTEAGFHPIGRVEGVYTDDPDTHRGAPDIAWDETANGLQIRDCGVNAPWVRYQRRVPLLKGAAWDSGEAYDAVDPTDAPPVVPPVARGDYAAFADVGAARAATILATRVDVLEDGNGDAATFWRDATYVDDELDVTGFVDAAGTAFRRVQRV